MVALAAGASGGVLATWILCDVMVLVDVPPTWVDRFWIALLCAGLAVAAVNLRRTTRRRKIGAIVAVLVFFAATAAAVNRDAGAYTTPSQALGAQQLRHLHSTPGRAKSAPLPLRQTWHAPSSLPRRGKLGDVTIPGTFSHFPARHAVVYLPPAALVARPPALPVVILLGGQPGSPEQVFTSTRLRSALDGFARKNRGLAPIVVAPDQLGTAHPNPMCVDGPLGNSATYITVDVTAWIRSHLPAARGRRSWAIGGFSQGGTCAIQFAAERPDLYGAFIDVAGETGPTLGSRATSIAQGFTGDADAFEQAQPESIMKRHRIYPDMWAIFAVGQTDTEYARHNRLLATDARSAGMHVETYVSRQSGHDWTTASRSFIFGIGQLYPRFGLSVSAQ